VGANKGPDDRTYYDARRRAYAQQRRASNLLQVKITSLPAHRAPFVQAF